jgi:two-component sensor histidine kinase
MFVLGTTSILVLGLIGAQAGPRLGLILGLILVQTLGIVTIGRLARDRGSTPMMVTLSAVLNLGVSATLVVLGGGIESEFWLLFCFGPLATSLAGDRYTKELMVASILTAAVSMLGPHWGEITLDQCVVVGMRCTLMAVIGMMSAAAIGALGIIQQERIDDQLAVQQTVARSLQEKETLLREIHHRVKNNLQIISSLLMLQSESITTDHDRALVHESAHRVRSMALIHEQLYGVESFESIDFGDYARKLACSLGAALAPAARFEVRSARVNVTVELAVPLGLVLNELITNACKYGLHDPTAARSAPPPRTGPNCDILVEVEGEGSEVRLTVTDFGPGLPPDFDVARSKSLGLQLVHSLVRQIRGELSVSSDGGARFHVVCSRPDHVTGDDGVGDSRQVSSG